MKAIKIKNVDMDMCWTDEQRTWLKHHQNQALAATRGDDGYWTLENAPVKLTDDEIEIVGLTSRDYADALAVQSACNASGIIHSLGRVIDKVWNEARIENQGTDFVNRHPIVQLFVHQLAWLTCGYGMPTDAFSKAYNECTRLAAETAPSEPPAVDEDSPEALKPAMPPCAGLLSAHRPNIVRRD
jgi:hypothetical protein